MATDSNGSAIVRIWNIQRVSFVERDEIVGKKTSNFFYVMRKLSYIFFALTVVILIQACSRQPKVTRTDTPTSGVAEIAVDECLAPIIQQEIDVFEALNHEASIIPRYTNELNAYDLLMADSLRLVIGTRDLTENEKKIIQERKRRPRSQRIAIDGIALIVNKANIDTLISVSDLKKIMLGEVRTWKELYPQSKLGDIAVGFDSPNSSTVRYIKDVVCEGKAFGDNIVAKSVDQETIEVSDTIPSQKVIDFVASTPNALGILGVNWVIDPADTTSLSFTNKVKVMSVSNELKATKEDSYKPYAAFIALEKYPLRRDVFVIITDVSGGLPSGFVTFVAGDRGQRIIVKSGLVPGTRPSRLIRVNPTFTD